MSFIDLYNTSKRYYVSLNNNKYNIIVGILKAKGYSIVDTHIDYIEPIKPVLKYSSLKISNRQKILLFNKKRKKWYLSKIYHSNAEYIEIDIKNVLNIPNRKH